MKIYKINTIYFPESEIESLKGRLSQNKSIFTTRISAELNKYKVGMILESNLGHQLKVISVKPISGVEEHPFIGELNQEQKTEIGDNDADLVELVLAK